MPIDRRITNGLAWAGALIVVAIPVADIAMSQFSGRNAPQVAVLDTEADADAVEPSMPTPSSERPRPQVVADVPKDATPAAATPKPATDTVTTATATRPATSGGNAVDSFVNSGRPLPSYITDGGGQASTPASAPTTPSAAAPTPVRPSPATTAPATPATAPAAPATAATTPPAAQTPTAPSAAATNPQQVAALPPARVTGFPTPVSERPTAVQRPASVQPPTSAQRPPVVAQPPLIIDQSAAPTITAQDLEDWESGPLSEFLANRQGGSQQVVPDYDPDGFFLDQGPNSSVRVQRFPRAYDDGFYPFQ